MSDISSALEASASGLRAQSARLRHVSENIANTDTPGYRRKTIPFRELMEGGKTNGMVEIGTVQPGPNRFAQDIRPSHPLADESGHYFGSNVDLVVELADAREAQRSYEANLKMFEQARQMSTRLLELLRK